MNNLNEIFLEELADIYDAEKQLIKALPKLAKSATSSELREAFESHLEETETHVERLDKVFELLDEKPKRKTCAAMKGLIEEGEEITKEKEKNATKDAGLICAAQKVEHYEIAAYGCLCAWAQTLEENDALELLQQNMEEEEAADEKLTEVAETSVNQEAADAGEEEEEMEEEPANSKKEDASE
jgi:ferritin-like metal-binding protein YciE